MEPNKPANMMDEIKGTYSLKQQAVLNLLQWEHGWRRL